MSDNFELDDLLKHLSPERHSDVFVFHSFPLMSLAQAEAYQPVSIYQEKEGLSLVITQDTADRMALTYHSVFALITLNVHSDLNAVGLTAAVSSALAKKGISCNVVAAFHHDHLFVPKERASEAMDILWNMSMNNFPHP